MPRALIASVTFPVFYCWNTQGDNVIPDRSLPFRFMLRLPGGRTATSFGVDVNSVTPDVISGKGDGICRGDEIDRLRR
jgi:hypothetical protein